MGKGDQRSRRGKIHRGTFGKRRPKNRAIPAKPAAEGDLPKKKPGKESKE